MEGSPPRSSPCVRMSPARLAAGSAAHQTFLGHHAPAPAGAPLVELYERMVETGRRAPRPGGAAAMRILTVGLLYPPHYLGGYELICEGVMEAARARGHDVRVVVSDYRAPAVLEPDAPGIHRTLRSYLDATAQEAVPLRPWQRLALERANGAELDRHLREFAPDVVSWWAHGGDVAVTDRARPAQGIAGRADDSGLLALLRSRDGRLDSHGQATAGRLAPVLEPLCGMPIRYQLETAGLYLFNSRYTSTAAAEAGFDAARSERDNPGVHGRFLTPAPAQPWSWRLLHVGRVHRDKGIDLAVAALAELPAEATLTIAGAGDERYAADLRRQAASLGVEERVLFAGPVAAESLPSLYAGRRRRAVPDPLGGALGARAAGGHGHGTAGRGDREGRSGHLPAR